jgi:DNA-binding FrmR family transcriptional regulator
MLCDVSHTVREKKQLLNRIRRIRGQIEGVERALENDDGCTEVLQRISAARGAMNSLMAEVVEKHVLEHVLATGATKGSKKAAGELADVVRSYLK